MFLLYTNIVSLLDARRHGLHPGLVPWLRRNGAYIFFPVNADVALVAARLADIARPQHIELADLLVAATAKTHGLCVLTRNLRHFVPTGIPTIDPTTALPADPAP
ncbi:MAG: PIN domain-containing protein [Roseiarcus sp.]